VGAGFEFWMSRTKGDVESDDDEDDEDEEEEEEDEAEAGEVWR